MKAEAPFTMAAVLQKKRVVEPKCPGQFIFIAPYWIVIKSTMSTATFFIINLPQCLAPIRGRGVEGENPVTFNSG